MIYLVCVMVGLGVYLVIVINVCGGVNEFFVLGDLMLIIDYINFIGENFLIGLNEDEMGFRFLDMS